jgi:hypothetical protein
MHKASSANCLQPPRSTSPRLLLVFHIEQKTGGVGEVKIARWGVNENVQENWYVPVYR